MSNLTLVVASYNHEELIPRALEAVAAQTERPELIVTDDASKDRSQEVIMSELQRLGLDARTIFHSENAGICRTFNEALALVETPLVAFISADDWMERTRVEEHAAVLTDASPDVALVYGDMFLDFSDGSQTYKLSELGWTEHFGSEGNVFILELRDHFLATPTVAMRTAAAREVGGYDESLKFEDLDMFLRLSRRYEVIFHAPPLVHYWRHPENFSSEMDRSPDAQQWQTLLSTYSKHLDAGDEAQAIIVPRLYDYACRLWKLDANPRHLAAHFWRHAKQAHSGKAALLAAAASIGLSGDIVFGSGNR